jgi:uncharacterized membrane protein
LNSAHADFLTRPLYYQMTGANMISLPLALPYLTLFLTVAAGTLALLLSMVGSPRLLVVFVATVTAGLLAAASTLHFFLSRSPLMFAALVPGLLGLYAVADVFSRLLGGVRLLELLG